MASTLSSTAVHRIITLVLYAPIGESEKKNAYYSAFHVLPDVNRKWKAIFILYVGIKPAPPLDYLDSLELALVLKGQLDDEDIRAIFAHGKPLKFWGCPQLLASKIVEAFTELPEEPAHLDVTITALSCLAATTPSEAWPQAYRTHLPCHACTSVESVEERRVTEE
ncbi:hypothetical protein AAVH_20155 [Aphelenchoides avenae]|nr:hypothetical protein AAVH_20155 [Aphelenchus avenae]